MRRTARATHAGSRSTPTCWRARLPRAPNARGPAPNVVLARLLLWGSSRAGRVSRTWTTSPLSPRTFVPRERRSANASSRTRASRGWRRSRVPQRRSRVTQTRRPGPSPRRFTSPARRRHPRRPRRVLVTADASGAAIKGAGSLVPAPTAGSVVALNPLASPRASVEARESVTRATVSSAAALGGGKRRDGRGYRGRSSRQGVPPVAERRRGGRRVRAHGPRDGSTLGCRRRVGPGVSTRGG